MQSEAKMGEVIGSEGSLTCLRWDQGLRSRALVPSGLGPRLFLHLRDVCYYRTGSRVQEARSGEILFDGGATECERQTGGMESGALEQVYVPHDLMNAAATQRAWQDQFGDIFPRGSTQDNAVLDWHFRQVLDVLTINASPPSVSRLETEARVRQAVLAVVEPLLIRQGHARTAEAQRLLHLEALARARSFMAVHVSDERYRMAQAADAAALSIAHFSQLFHRLTGLTAQEYLIRLRLERARLLLANSELSIGDVCYESGFRHLSHFAAMFRRATGVTPTDWRQEECAGDKRCLAVALGALPGERMSSPSAARALPLYIRRGSALYLTHLALAHRSTADGRVLEILRPFLSRPERRNRAVRLIGVICEGTGEAGVEAIRRVFSGTEEAQDLMPLALGDALRGRPFTEVAASLAPYLAQPNMTSIARRHATFALGTALRDTAEERVLEWLPRFFRTGDGILDNLGVVSLGLIFRGSANTRVIALLSGCLAERIARDVHDHTLSPACLCNSSSALALICRGTARAPEILEAINPLLRSRDRNTVHDGVSALARLFTGQAPDGLAALLPYVSEGHFPALLALFDGAPAMRALPTIESLWSHPSPMLRRSMAITLGIIYQGTGDEHARHLLAQNIRRGFPKLRGDSLMALGLVHHRSGHDSLLPVAKSSVRATQPYLTRSALLSVGLGLQGTANAEAVEWAVSFVGDSNRYVAAAAVQCLGLLGQGTEDDDVAARIQELSRGNRRLTNDADLALLMLDFDIKALELLSYWDGYFPRGEYASSFNLALRFFARGPGSRWDVDEPLNVG